MKIARVETWVEQIPLRRPYTIAFKHVEEVDLYFVRLISDDGHVGLGSGAPTDVTGETVADSYTVLEAAGHGLLKGQDPRCLRALTRQLIAEMPDTPSARAALDMALYDLVANSYGVTVAKMLGQCHEALPTSITIGIMPLDETLREAAEYLGQGFRCLKVKIGLDYQEDLERLRALRSQLGPDILIRVDANQGYTSAESQSLAKAAQELNLELIEQPLPAGSVDEMRVMSEDVRAIMAADESLHGPGDALALTQGRPFGIYNIKLMKCGGITGALAIADIAEQAGIALMWGCMDESVVGIDAALHAAYACPATCYLDLDGSFDLSTDIAEQPFTLDSGTLSIRDRPQ